MMVASPTGKGPRVNDTPGGAEPPASDDFDYSTPEGMAALDRALDVVLEIREERPARMARRIALYEKTLGLAVIPVLVRRACVAGLRALKKSGPGRP